MDTLKIQEKTQDPRQPYDTCKQHIARHRSLNLAMQPTPENVFLRLTAEQVAFAYKLRRNIEIFFGWWKRHLKVYHLISRSQYGLMVQMLAGLITYILLAIYCYDQHHEKVSVKRLREISINIRNEMSIEDIVNETGVWCYQPSNLDQSHANP